LPGNSSANKHVSTAKEYSNNGREVFYEVRDEDQLVVAVSEVFVIGESELENCSGFRCELLLLEAGS
jgi:hypothetical protein